MFSQLFDLVRTASELSMQTQRSVMDQWFQQGASGSADKPEGAAGSAQARWSEFVNTSLAKQREMFDASYRAGVQLLQQAAHLSEVKSMDERRRLLSELLRNIFELSKKQSETQLDEMMRAARFWFETARR